MKKYVRWSGIVVASPFILFIILCILIYIPPIQHFLVSRATEYASTATGMNVSIGRLSLSFPLDLVVHETTVTDKEDTLLHARKLTVNVQLLPLLKQKVELDGLRLEDAEINTLGLIPGMSLKGNLGELFVASHGVALDKETAVVNKFLLKDTHLALVLADTTAADTTTSEPLYWKVNLEEADMSNVSFELQLPLDTMDFSIAVETASLRDGHVDLHKQAYTARSFTLTEGTATLHTGNRPPAAEGLDPSYIVLTDMNAAVDSLYYAGNDIHALIRNFGLKERSGLQVTSAEGRLVSDSKQLNVPQLQIKTPNSYIEMSASMDWDATDASKAGNIRARLMADIGKGDFLKVVTGMPEDFVKQYPAEPLKIRAGIDGNLKKIDLTTLTIALPGAFNAGASGSISLPLDSLKRHGSMDLTAETGDLKFVECLTGGIHIPQRMKLEGNAGIAGNRLTTDLKLLAGRRGKVTLAAAFHTQEEAYEARLRIDSLNLHRFLPQDSLYGLSAGLEASGQGLDFFSPNTQASLEGSIDYLRYGKRVFTGIGLDAELKQSKATANLRITDEYMDIASRLEALLHPSSVKADLHTDVNRLDLLGMGVTKKTLTPSMDVDIHAETDMEARHKVRASVTGVTLQTGEKSFKTKDLHVGFGMTPDSVRSFVNAGDLTFLFRSANSLDRLLQHTDQVMTELASQWEQKSINQALVRELLPHAELRVFSGKDNPIANMLSINHIHYDRLRAELRTSPQDGLNGGIDLYGLRTDSLRLDTIYFTATQDTARLQFHSGVKALANKQQEAFNIGLDGYIASTDAGLGLTYLNGKGEKGLDFGMKAQLHEHGISLRVSPLTPIFVYRPFRANEDNYIYLSDGGRIHANLKLYDENHSGLGLYSTPDTLALQDLTLALSRIDIGEFRRIIPYMPDVAGFINAEVHYIQTQADMQVAAEVNVEQLAYNKYPMGNWGMSAVYLPRETGEHSIDGFITLNEEEIISLGGTYMPGEEGKEDYLDANLGMHHFPLAVANAFIPDRMALLDGDLDGTLAVKGSTARPLLNGQLGMDSVTVNVPQVSLNLRFDNRPVKITDSKLTFDKFSIFTQGETPFTIDGYVDMADLEAINMDLRMNAKNYELFNAKRSKESLVHGKLYVDFNSRLMGTLDELSMKGNMNILGKSDFTYILRDSPLTVEDRLGETVTFTDFRDSTHVAGNDLQTLTLGGLDILMTLHIDEAVQARVDLDEGGSNYMLLEGGGDLSFQYQPDGNMLLNGRYSLISGEMKYEMPIIPLKTFHIQEGSYIEWTGNPMNPLLSIKATERMRASVTSDDKTSRKVNFDVGVSLTNRLENLGLVFTLEAPDDGTMQNELAAKSEEERNKLAVTMLVTGMYMADNNSGKGLDTNSMLNSFLEGEISKIAGSALKTIDINFGMETTDDDGTGSSRTDYNIQFAKRFWNNRFQVVIGGKISTGNDAQQQDESFIDNISLEYRLDNSGTRYIKIFHDKNYESVLDGEVIETGAGLVLRKKVGKLSELFIFRNRKKEENVQEEKQEKKTDR